MKAHIVTIGDEILSGQITDLNAPFIANYLKEIGVNTTKISSIGDNAIDLKNILSSHSSPKNTTESELEIVVITGGLGPTEDDITKKVWCDFFKDTLQLSNEVLTHVAQITNTRSLKEINPRNRAQALVPSKSEIIFNKIGSAPGIWHQINQTIFVAMPGVPAEMQCMLKEQVIPKLKKQFTFEKTASQSLYVYGIAESVLAGLLQDIETDLNLKKITIAYLPYPGRVQLQLKTKFEKALKEAITKIQTVLENNQISYTEEQVAEVKIAEILTKTNTHLAFAESCTGGSLAAIFTSKAGASKFFKGSMVTYATEAKQNILNVKPETITTYSEVSKQTVEQMAIGAKEVLKSDIALATTGYTGGVPYGKKGKPGQVWFAIAWYDKTTNESKIDSWYFDFKGTRTFITQKAVQKAMELLYNVVIKIQK